jgi:SAM-dependent methyltransferase
MKVSTISKTFKRLRGDVALRHEIAGLSAQIARLEALVNRQAVVLDGLNARLGGPSSLTATVPPATPRLKEDLDSWKNKAQPGELAFHKRPNDRSGADWHRLNSAVWRRYGFEPTGLEGKVIIDIGAGSRLRTLYFEGARIVAIEPLANQFIAQVEWNDLDQAERVFAVPAEVEIPELTGTADFVVSINALDHGFNFDDSVRNVRRYLRHDGAAFLSFDQHHTPDDMHPLVLTDPIVREVFERCSLRVDRFEEKFRYHGGPGPQALNYWLSPA